MGWVEVLVLVLLFGVVAGVAVPRAQQIRDGAVAREALTEFEGLRREAADHRAATGDWPPRAAPGFQIEAERYTMEWEHWRLPEGLPRHPDIRVLAGITLTTEMPRVAEALARSLAGDAAWFALGDRYMFIFEGF
jgi:type II secretory pathway pseudopilin PulG